jgi:hypothetical protein
MSSLQMHRDRVGPGVEPFLAQVFAELDDLLLERLRDLVGTRSRAP